MNVEDYKPYLPQRVNESASMHNGWTKFEIETSERTTANTSSRVTVQSANEMKFVDLSIEQYTGKTRRAKYTSVRLEEPAARRLYELLAKKFA